MAAYEIYIRNTSLCYRDKNNVERIIYSTGGHPSHAALSENGRIAVYNSGGTPRLRWRGTSTGGVATNSSPTNVEIIGYYGDKGKTSWPQEECSIFVADTDKLVLAFDGAYWWQRTDSPPPVFPDPPPPDPPAPPGSGTDYSYYRYLGGSNDTMLTMSYNDQTKRSTTVSSTRNPCPGRQVQMYDQFTVDGQSFYGNYRCINV